MTSPPNPYKPPAAPVTPRDPDGFGTRTRTLKFLAVAVAGAATLTAGLAPAVLNSFREIYAGFGAELPLLSRIALGSMWIWTLLAVASIGVAVWIGLTDSAPRATLLRMRLAVVLLAVAVVVFFLVTLISLYLPIFSLGAVV